MTWVDIGCVAAAGHAVESEEGTSTEAQPIPACLNPC
jgi:hypothetical protein